MPQWRDTVCEKEAGRMQLKMLKSAPQNKAAGQPLSLPQSEDSNTHHIELPLGLFFPLLLIYLMRKQLYTRGLSFIIPEILKREFLFNS